jgi:hypothetical protein
MEIEGRIAWTMVGPEGRLAGHVRWGVGDGNWMLGF